MINRIKSILLSLSAVLVFALTAAIPAAVSAQDNSTPCNVAGTSAGITPGSTNQCLCNGSYVTIGTAQNCSDQTGSISKIITTVINVLSLIIGAVAVIMIIWGGFRYITSAGNAEGAKGARNTIIYAVVGLVIVAIAQVVVHFVINTSNNAVSP